MASLIVLIGPTGAGKSVQGDLLAQELDGVHLSSGDLLRRDVAAAAAIADGKLAPAEHVERIVGEAVAAIPADHPIIMDGVTRTMSNVRWLEGKLTEWGRELQCVVLIELDLETSMKRLGLRHRADDAPEAVKEKWDEYTAKTQPVVDYYDSLGLLRRIDGRGSVDEVQRLMRNAIS